MAKVELRLNKKLMGDLAGKASRKTISTRDGDRISYDEFFAGSSKPIIDEIDRALGRHYGLTAEEVDQIINFDIKFRIGQNSEVDE